MKRGISSIEADGCSTTYDQIAQPALARGNILDMRVLQIASVVIDVPQTRMSEQYQRKITLIQVHTVSRANEQLRLSTNQRHGYQR